MKDTINNFIQYLEHEKGLSLNTCRAYQYDITKFFDYTGPQLDDYKDVTKEHIRSFMFHLSKNGIRKPNCASTRCRKLYSLSSFFNFLIKEGVLNNNPVQDVSAPKINLKESTYLMPEEVQEVLDVVNENPDDFYRIRDLAIFAIFLGTGIRLSELTNIRLEDLDINNKLLKVVRKGGRE